MHGGVVVCGSLHRQKPRGILFEAVRKLGDVCIIWIDSDDRMADKRMRLLAKGKLGRFASLAALRAVMQHTFEAFEVPVIQYRNDAFGGEAVARFLDFYTKSFLRS